MIALGTIVGALVLFFVGLRLSAFFSGTETGFYRVSFLRLSIEAHAGDRASERILWFARNPSYFVATTLVGNNIANYLTTLAIGLTLVGFGATAGWPEIVATLLLAPVIFVFGELIPKNLYYRAPLSLLRRDAAVFVIFYRLFLVVSFPLIWISKLFERFGSPDNKQLELVLGRSRLVQVLSEGHREGLLTDVQSRLVHGLMQTAARPVTESMIPTGRVLGVAENESRDAVLEFARRYGLPCIAVKRNDGGGNWYGYWRVVDLAVSEQPHTSLIRTMPKIDAASSKLECMLTLRQAGEIYGVVCAGEDIIGVVSEHGLVEQLFQPPQVMGARSRPPK